MESYERLSAQDASFLVYEDIDATAHMHIGGFSVYEGGGLTNDRGGVDIDRVRAYVESRLHAIPRYRQKLAYTPVDGHPVWIDDDRFNVRYHVRHTRLPRPGGDRELAGLVGRIMSQRLDRTRPLWELWVVEGLPNGQWAMVTKTHHCMIDGVSGVDISTVLMRLEPDDTIEEPPPWDPRPAPGRLELFADEAKHRLKAPVDLATGFRDTIQTLTGETKELERTLEALKRMAGIALQGAAETPFNKPLGPHRRFAWTAIGLDEAKFIKNELGGTLNDVVLAVVAGAVGSYLRGRRVNVEILDFIAAIPVNARSDDDRSMGNQVAAWLARLPIAEEDPIRRLELVREVTTELKTSGSADPTSYLYKTAEFGGPAALSLVVQLTQKLSPCNLIVTNVPGPPFPLYLLSSKMVSANPMVTLLAEQGLGVAVFSYMGRLQFGFNADWDLMPDLDRFVAGVEKSLDELRHAAHAKSGATP